MPTECPFKKKKSFYESEYPISVGGHLSVSRGREARAVTDD